MKILVVDDEESSRKLVVKGLEEKGFQLFSASGPEEALKILEKEQDINWVITDMIMPDIDGDEFIKILSEGKYENIRVIAMTSHSLGLLNKTFAKHKEKKKVFPVLKPVNFDMITRLIQMG